MPETHSYERKVGYAIVGTVLLTILGGLFAFLFMVYTGAIETNLTIGGEITISGAVPFTSVLFGVMLGFGIFVYIGLTFIGGTEDVKQATEDAMEVQEEATGETDEEE